MQHRTLNANGIRMHFAVEGEGEPLVLLHGWPQTSYMWRKVMPTLAQRFTVVAPDLRGYGLSGKPAGGYDKRTMAADVRALVKALGFERIRLVGHDRGARVAHRYALDYGDEVLRLALLDIIPTRAAFERTNKDSARASWHWHFHQVPDLPEILVGANPEAYLRYFLHAWAFQKSAFSAEDIAEYLRAFTQPGAIRAGFDDYRAGATTDWEDDRADAGRKIDMPLLVLWGAESHSRRSQPTLEVWDEYASDVRGEAIPECGHYLPEEQPEVVAAKLMAFLEG